MEHATIIGINRQRTGVPAYLLAAITAALAVGTFALACSTRALTGLAKLRFDAELRPVPTLEWSYSTLGKGRGVIEVSVRVLSATKSPVFVDPEEVDVALVALSSNQGHFAHVKLEPWTDHRQVIHVWIAPDDLSPASSPEFGLRLTFGVYSPSVTDVQRWSAIVAFVDTPEEMVEVGEPPYTAHALGPICRCGDRDCQKRQDKAIQGLQKALATSPVDLIKLGGKRP